ETLRDLLARDRVEQNFLGCHVRVSLLLENREDIFLAQNEVLLAVDLDLGARVLADEDLVALLDLERLHLAVVEDLAVTDGDDLGLERLLLGGVGDEEPASSLLLLGEALGENAVVQRSDAHGRPPSFSGLW